VPLRAYLRAGVAGLTAFGIGFSGTAAFSVIVFIVVSNWYGPPLPEREEIARHGALACCILIGVLLGWLAARRKIRR
jgi:hypothetical protein